eukprot:TRINITY_DN2058_c0_g1_i16.p1 TRINITY_DN2058_c0_g1~~TRINITY_DN2058_c0_g1_i16.p1  ORF type:complete len:115 (-),score=8.51 TRINITY_DN2058_c0_g1_i16:394-738(-)
MNTTQNLKGTQAVPYTIHSLHPRALISQKPSSYLSSPNQNSKHLHPLPSPSIIITSQLFHLLSSPYGNHNYTLLCPHHIQSATHHHSVQRTSVTLSSSLKATIIAPTEPPCHRQ